MNELVLRLEIRGRVQGVGYRAAMADEAQRLGLRGWVRNRRDASVEAVIAGTDEAVQRLLQWARRGPPAARVDSVASFPATGSFTAFEQWPTS